LIFWLTTPPSTPAFSAICLIGGLDGPADDVDADPLVLALRVLAELAEHAAGGADHGDAAAGQDAFLDGRAAGVKGVLDTRLLLLHRDFRCGPDLDLRHAAGQLGQTLLELLAVVVAGRVVDLVLQLADAAGDGLVVAGALDDGGVVFVHVDLLGAAELADLDVLELDAELFEDRLPAGEDRDVLEHGLAAIAEPGAFTAHTLSVPRSLFTTSVASASPSRSSLMISIGLPCSAALLSTGTRSRALLIFFSWIRM
jgi:hypothetical protein